MIEIFLYSPLEQFEFTLISGITAQNSILELLLPIDKATSELNTLLLPQTAYREAVKENVYQMLNIFSAGLNERFYCTPKMYDEISNLLTTETIKTTLYSGSEGSRWYKNLDVFYIWADSQNLIQLMYELFPQLLKDQGNLFDWEMCFIDQECTRLGIAFSTELGENSLPTEEKTFAIIAAYILNDLYLPSNSEGINPTLTFITNVYYNWIADRIVLNELLEVQDFELHISDILNNNKIGLTGIHMTTRDYTGFTFFWLNIYNSLFIVITLIILIFIVFNQGYAKVPNIWQILNTLTFDFLVKSFISLANKNLLAFFPIFFCFFIFIYLLNLTALTPFSFCLTSNLWFSLSLSFSVWFGVTALAIIVKGHEFFIGFVPKNIASNELKVFITIIEVISYVARALSLGVRIFANMLAGHSLVHILSDLTATCFVEFDNIGLKIFGIFPAIILSFILVIEFGICFLQGLVFVILMAIYLKEAFEGH